MSDSTEEIDSPVCIVDDDPVARKMLTRLLGWDGWPVRCFENGEEFIGYARGHAVALALVDVSMPGLGGLEVQAMLREFSPDTRTIMITARDDRATRDAALEGGADHFLLKPFREDELLRSMHHTLGSM